VNGRDRFGGLSYRAIAGLGLGLLVLLFIVMNRDGTEISFVVFSREVEVWVALAIAALGGLVVGFLLGRSRYRR
jgi:uncharacterized integral membrane protein